MDLYLKQKCFLQKKKKDIIQIKTGIIIAHLVMDISVGLDIPLISISLHLCVFMMHEEDNNENYHFSKNIEKIQLHNQKCYEMGIFNSE